MPYRPCCWYCACAWGGAWRPLDVSAAQVVESSNGIIVALENPGTDAVVMSTPEDWESILYDAEGNLIPSVSDQKRETDSSTVSAYADLTIRQELLSFADFTAPFLSVYQVDVRSGNKLVFSDTVGIQVENADPVELVVDGDGKIPAGAEVAVRLLYAGPAYSLYSEQDDTVTWSSVPDGKDLAAGFALCYNFTNANGGGIVNPFPAVPEPVIEGSVVLPDTGGTGTWPVLLSGIALACAGCIGMYLKKKERDRNAEV